MPRGKYTYDYPRPAVTVDVAIVSSTENSRVLLVRRKNAPFAGTWALPGGFVEMDESLDDAARRELLEETGVKAGKLIQLHTFGDPGRDPRGRTISVVYLALIDPAKIQPCAGDDAAEVGWFSLLRPPPLAFDHKDIFAHVRRFIRSQGSGVRSQESASSIPPRFEPCP